MKCLFLRHSILSAAALFGGLIAATSAAACTVAPNYTGNYGASYTAGPHAGSSYTFGISTSYVQAGTMLYLSYQTSSGVQGVGSGILDTASCTAKISSHNTTPSCQGTYVGVYDFTASNETWTFSGSDCWGTLNGSGTASVETFD